MSNCTLSKNKTYEVQKISFNPSTKSYQLTFAEKTPQCPEGIFTSKKLELKIVANNQIPFLRFNAQDNAPELTLNNMALVNAPNTRTLQTQTQTQTFSKNPVQNPTSQYSFLYIILGIVIVILLFRFIFKKRDPQPPYYPGNNNPNNMLNSGNNPNDPNNNPNNNPNNGQGQFNNGPMAQQPPSRTGTFLTGLAGGAIGSIVGNELYDKFKGNNAQAAQPPPPPPATNPNDTFSSDSDNDNSNFSSDDDDGSSDSFSSDD